MQTKRMMCMVLSCMLLVGMLSFPAHAAEVVDATTTSFTPNLRNSRAMGSFNMTVSGKALSLATSSFPLAAGETVTINASYAPFDASVDFGLVDSDGVFHYFNVTTGSIDKTILIEKNGNYTLQIRNNSSSAVKVSGFVNY